MALDLEQLRPNFDFRADRSAGPGGQNVNKVNTRITLLFDFENCAALSGWQKGRIRRQLPSRLSRDGRLRIVSQTERSQHANRARAEERLLEILRATFRRQKKRKPTRPTRGSKERRLKAKKERGQIKKLRQQRPRAE